MPVSLDLMRTRAVLRSCQGPWWPHMWRKAEGTPVATQGVSLTHWLSNLTSFLCLVDPVCLAGSVLDEPASLSLPRGKQC